MNDITSVLLDTSFLMHIINRKDEFHKNAMGYFRYFSDYQITMFVSTITISEYAVVCDTQIFKDLQVLKFIDFNYSDALKAGRYTSFLKKHTKPTKNGRSIAVNDLKLLAQLDNRKINAFVSNDQKLKVKAFDPLCNNKLLKGDFIDFTRPLNEFLGTLF